MFYTVDNITNKERPKDKSDVMVAQVFNQENQKIQDVFMSEQHGESIIKTTDKRKS